MKIGIVSKKGGVGKSMLARLVAASYASANWDVLIADLDTGQTSCVKWATRRNENEITPSVDAHHYKNLKRAIDKSESYDLVIFDGKPLSSVETFNIAKASDLTIIPTGTSLDDLIPTIELAHELNTKGIDSSKIRIAFCRIGTSDAELNEAKDILSKRLLEYIEGFIPEKTAIRRAMDEGKAANETKYSTINETVNVLVQSIINACKDVKK